MRKLALLFLCILPLHAWGEEKIALPATITVHGDAVTKVAPDRVTLPVTVREENITLKTAKEKHDEKLRNLLELAETSGIKKEDIQTSYTSISPQYDYHINASPKLRAYEVQTSINFTLKIPTLAGFMDKVLGLGITTVGDVSYSLKDEEKIKEDTLAKAVEKAYEKASRIANAAKVTIDKPLVIEEGGMEMPRPIRPMIMAKAPMAMASMAPPPPELPSGLVNIEQSVTVTYQLKP